MDLVGVSVTLVPTGMHLVRLLEPDDKARAVTAGIGHALPTTIVTNDDLAAPSTPPTSGSAPAVDSGNATSPPLTWARRTSRSKPAPTH